MNRYPSDIDRLQADDINGVRALYGTDPGAGSPDLVVQSLRVDNPTPVAGDIFTLSATVRNMGNGTAAATTLRYYYWQSSSREWVIAGYDSVPSLPESATSPESISLRAPSRTGNHWYTACVASVAGEQNRSNCGDNVRVTVNPEEGGAAPDLIVEPVGQYRPIYLEENFAITWRYINVGDADAPGSLMRFYRRPAGGSWSLEEHKVVPRLPLSFPARTTRRGDRLGTPGTYYYVACIRAVEGERKRDNNCSRPVQILILPCRDSTTRGSCD